MSDLPRDSSQIRSHPPGARGRHDAGLGGVWAWRAGGLAWLGCLLASLAASHLGAGQVWAMAVAALVLVGLPVGMVAAFLVRENAKRHAEQIDALYRRLDELDAVMIQPRETIESASAEMFERIDAAVRQAELLREIADGVHGVEALFDLDGRLLWISPSVMDLTGVTPSECLVATDPLVLLVHESDLGYCRRVIKRVLEQGDTECFEMRLRNRTGQVCWVACRWARVYRCDRLLGLRMSAENVQARKETEYKLLETVAELRRSQALREHYLSRSNDERMRLTALLNVIRLGILFMNRDHRVLYFNRAMLDIWGFPPDENLIGVRDEVLRNRVAPLLEDPERYFRSIQEVIEDGGDDSSREILFKDGRIVTDASAIVEGGPENRGIGRVWIYEDVTEQRRIGARLIQLAERDPLTDLFNRRRFHEELDRLLVDAERRRYDVGLLIFDLDGFKPINDDFGHQAGDEVLVTMSREVGSIIRRNETFFRLGGDEFAVLVPDAAEGGLLELARRIVEGVAGLRFSFEGKEARLTASLGIARYPRNAADAERLIAAADHAMYQSKANGRNQWTIAPNVQGESDRMSAEEKDLTNRRED